MYFLKAKSKIVMNLGSYLYYLIRLIEENNLKLFSSIKCNFKTRKQISAILPY